MRITRIVWQPFRVPLRQPFMTAHGVRSAREGLIIRVETDAGITGVGEASPLPEFGGRSVVETAVEIAQAADQLRGLAVTQAIEALQRLHPMMHLSGPAAFGLDVALHDLHARSLGMPLSRLLSPHPASSVPVNAVLSAASPDGLVHSARNAVAEGFQTLKIKVASTPSLTDDVERVRAVREAVGPTVRIRLDANGGWQVREAIDVLNRLEPLGIELIEQPVAADDLVGMAAVRRATAIPVAADESASDLPSLMRVIDMAAADCLVIKPMVVGRLATAIDVVTLTERAGMKTFLTTTIDSGVGIAAALHLAAVIVSGDLACGLATARLLEATLVTDLPEPRNGLLAVPERPGLGVGIDQRAVERYSIAASSTASTAGVS